MVLPVVVPCTKDEECYQKRYQYDSNIDIMYGDHGPWWTDDELAGQMSRCPSPSPFIFCLYTKSNKGSQSNKGLRTRDKTKILLIAPGQLVLLLSHTYS